LIYLASAGSFVNAWRSYRSHGGFGSAASASLTWGLVLAVIASIFMFNLQWDQWWPAVLIAVGLGIVVGYVWRLRGGDPEDGSEG
jgi:NAD/NADP transhydrogenase beta subunit